MSSRLRHIRPRRSPVIQREESQPGGRGPAARPPRQCSNRPDQSPSIGRAKSRTNGVHGAAERRDEVVLRPQGATRH
jgi:hypothetical protein